MRLRRDKGDAPVDDPDLSGGGVATLEAPPEQTVEPTARKRSWLQSILQFEITTKKVPRRDLMHFSRQMAVFVKAGIPILEAIDGITEEMGNDHFKEILEDVKSRL